MLNTSDVKTERSFDLEVVSGTIKRCCEGMIHYGRRVNLSGILIDLIFI